MARSPKPPEQASTRRGRRRGPEPPQRTPGAVMVAAKTKSWDVRRAERLAEGLRAAAAGNYPVRFSHRSCKVEWLH